MHFITPLKARIRNVTSALSAVQRSFGTFRIDLTLSVSQEGVSPIKHSVDRMSLHRIPRNLIGSNFPSTGKLITTKKSSKRTDHGPKAADPQS